MPAEDPACKVREMVLNKLRENTKNDSLRQTYERMRRMRKAATPSQVTP